MAALRPLFSLLIATSLLLVGHGLHLTLLPLRAASLGLSETLIGLTASAYFFGFVTGCLFIPNVIARVGHIRSFAALLALFASTMLALSFASSAIFWFVARFVIGVMMCGAYTVIESWLTDQTAPEERGKTLATYTFIILIAMSAGQFILPLAPITSPTPFMLVAMLAMLAIVPVSLTRSLAPAPIPATRVSFTLLYQRSHSAFAGGLTSGIIMGTFWSLGAVYAMRTIGDKEFVSLFITATILGGAIAQYPIGWLSDRFDRQYVLVLLCVLTSISALMMSIADTKWPLLAAAFCFGSTANAIYAVTLAKAADNSNREEFVTVASTVLLLNSLGAATAPIIFGQLMASLNESALFISVAVASLCSALYIAKQPKSKTAVSVAEQTDFVVAATEMVPAGFDSDPRSPLDTEESLEPAEETPSIYDQEQLREQGNEQPKEESEEQSEAQAKEQLKDPFT